MNPRIKQVRPNNDYTLTLTFTNGEVRLFNMSPYLNKGIFKALRNKDAFSAVKPFMGSIKWPGGQDLCPDTLYLESKQVKSLKDLGSIKE